MPWTHWLGWPWFSHSFTSKADFSAGRLLAVDDAFEERVGARCWEWKACFLPVAHVLASNASPGAVNTGFGCVDGELVLGLGEAVGGGICCHATHRQRL